MRKGTARFLAGILAAQLALSGGIQTSAAVRTETELDNQPVHSEEYPNKQEPEAVQTDNDAQNSSGDQQTGASTEENEKEPSELEEEQNQEEVSDSDSQIETEQSATLSEEKAVPDEENSADTVLDGRVEVVLTSGIPLEREQSFQVKLAGSDQKEQTLVLGNSQGTEASQDTAVFAGLTPGKSYELIVTGAGYVTYRQTIAVEGMGYRIQLYTGESLGFEENAHPGILVYGDVNGDGILDMADGQLLVDSIDQNQYQDALDLNKDAQVDLVDLQYFTDAYEDFQQVYATIETFILKEAAVVEHGASTSLKGDPDSIWSEEGSVQLIPAGGGTISAANPVEISFSFQKTAEPVMIEGFVLESPVESAVEQGTIVVEYEENGQSKILEQVFGNTTRAASQGITVTTAQDGSLTVDLNQQVAVKKVTIRITATSGSNNLAEITKVEFLNDMESKIPAPAMDIPQEVKAEAGNKEITISWKKANNVTGYEVVISDGKTTDHVRTTQTSMKISQFGGKKLENKTTYTLKVRSINGDWKSGYSQEVTATPRVDTIPDAPDSVQVTGKYKALEIRWKAPKDNAADTYTLYYKKKSAEAYDKIQGITGTYYLLSGLQDATSYQVYVTASNDLGEGPASLTAEGSTLSAEAVSFPQYKILNEEAENGELTSHIVNAVHVVGEMVDSPLDEGDSKSAYGLVDNNPSSYYHLADWDDAVYYHQWQWGVTVELDDTYKMDRFTFAGPDSSYNYYRAAAIYYWDQEQNKEVAAANVSLLRKTDSEGRTYYLIKLKDPIETNKVRFGFSTWSVRNIGISEIRFYEYDSLEADIQALYADDLHLELNPEVNETVLDELQKRLDAQDHQEYHPDREALQKELDAARQLLEEQELLSETVTVNPMISTAKDQNLGITGLNAWQPLGVTAAADEELIVYVGGKGIKSGQDVPLRLVFTQNHAESDQVAQVMGTNLKTGRNEITVPQLTSTDRERGGTLYIQYTGTDDNASYAVRVSGGNKIPTLNLYGTEGQERSQRIRQYVSQLESYVAELDQKHQELHSTGENKQVQYAYDEKNCILNTTDIMLDHMMLSLPATQVFRGLDSGDRVSALENSLEAMDQMLLLFYQHKGLTDSFAEGTDSATVAANRLPSQHLNIRYMTMFSGAFMYAAGNHIGIEWTETPGMVQGTPVQTQDGKKISGEYFGWGIAHEIGHEINQSAYAVAEVTNNYFSILAQADETNNAVRFQYQDVYDKVTSGALGSSSNVFTQLGMYWQLHLAYDRGYNYKTYDNYQEIFQNLFYARVDSYARRPQTAPAPNGVTLTLGGDAQQNFMRLASAAAQKDLTEFFQRWGMIPDKETTSYIGQFEKETRAIYYVNDEARAYEIENGGTSGTILNQDVVQVETSVDGSQVTLEMSTSTKTPIIGYEIVRVITEGGQQQRQMAGFTTDETYTDNASFLGNRTVFYEVAAVDSFTNRSAFVSTNSEKLSGDGLQDKGSWTVETNMSSDQDSIPDASEEDPCAPAKQSAAVQMIDGKTDTTYVGGTSKEDPYILLKFNRNTEVTALRYRLSTAGTSLSDYRIEISSDGSNFTKVKEGTFQLSQGSQTIYFTNRDLEGNQDGDPWVATYDTSYLRITAVGQAGEKLSVSEIDILGPSGDNVEWLTKSEASVGILKEDYTYQEEKENQSEEKIPAGSIVFTGTYKGNPAYNVVLLYDEKGNIVGGTDSEGNLTAQQIILAPNPGDALLGETSEGTWIYWIEPQDQGEKLPTAVRAELYRVDDALTNQGQRMVSDTPLLTLPDKLPEITLN